MKKIRTPAFYLGLVGLCSGLGCATSGNGDPSGGSNNGTGGNNSPPTATFTIKKTALKAQFDASGISSPTYATADLLVRWDYTNDGTFDTDWSATKTTSYTYPADGSYTAKLEIKDPAKKTDSATKYFTITATNTSPTPVFNVSLAKGMDASLDASSSNDAEDRVEDLRVRWDFDGDGAYDTDWTTDKTVEHTYETAGEYTVKLQVKDLNEAAKTASQTIVASPITLRNSFLTYGPPYMIKVHFRAINNLTGQPVTPTDVPPLTRAYFSIFEDNLLIDMSETNQILYNGKRPLFIVLVLDFTGSMYDAGAVNSMIDSAKAFIESQGDSTYLSLWAFWERDGGNAQITDYTPCSPAGRSTIETALEAFAAQYHDRGATQIWDVLDNIIATKFPAYDNGVNRGIIFLSDGHDTTSKTNISTLIDRARKKAVCLFSVGLAFRPLEYPADEPNLKKVAEDTGGLYFTVNQVTDLSTVFQQLSEDVNADWTLSYITLKSTGTHTLKVLCNYLEGYAKMTGKFPITKEMQTDIKKGLFLAFPALTPPAGATEYTLYADYIPRNVSIFRIKVTSAASARLMLYDSDSICKPADGWTISPDVAAGEPVPADGWYTLSSISPLEYGSWGNVARCIVDDPNLPAVHFEFPALTDQAALYGDKTIVFEIPDDVALDVP